MEASVKELFYVIDFQCQNEPMNSVQRSKSMTYTGKWMMQVLRG